MTQLDLLTLTTPDMPPPEVPQQVWTLFCAEADLMRSYRDHYSARTIAEYIRHNFRINNAGREFVINNNWVPAMARAYMASRGCEGFFETRGGC